LEAFAYAIKQVGEITMTTPDYVAKMKFNDGFARFERKLTPNMILSCIVILHLKNIFEVLCESETLRKLAITAIAIKRYQLRHHHLPAKLSQLVPDILPYLPIDPMDRKPLRYSVNLMGQMSLYSVGDDGSDDHGDPSMPDSIEKHICAGKDWVWPIPATQNEIDKANNKAPPRNKVIVTVE
jgi:hypothetical protein